MQGHSQWAAINNFSLGFFKCPILSEWAASITDLTMDLGMTGTTRSPPISVKQHRISFITMHLLANIAMFSPTISDKGFFLNSLSARCFAISRQTSSRLCSSNSDMLSISTWKLHINSSMSVFGSTSVFPKVAANSLHR